MPASSHGLPTSLIRSTGAPQPGQAILTASTYGRCGRVALERLPALDRALLELLATADDLDRAARRAVVDRQRQPPVALLADHPVVHVAEPVQLALVAEVRDPADLVDDVHDLVAQAGVDLLPGQRLARLVVQRTHADVPLVDEAEDERRAAPPAVRVAVVDRLEPVEAALALEVLDDRLGDVADVAPGQRAEAVEEDPGLVERRDDRQPERACRAGSPRRRSPARCGRCRSPRPRRPRSRRRPDARTGTSGASRRAGGERRSHGGQVVERARRSASRPGPRRAPPRGPRTARRARS